MSQDGQAADLERALARVLWILRNYLPDLVIIGGWVPYLYRHYSGDPWVGRQSRTAEVDVLTTPSLPVRDGVSLDETLRAAGLLPARETGPSAVWSATDQSGEEIEFLTPLRGTALQQGATVSVPGHGRIGAIGLSGLDLLGQHTTTLIVSVGEFDGRMHEVTVRVPPLGVYVVAKAATVLARRPHADGSNPKQAKDLVYLHDVMAAGDVVRRRVESDIRAMQRRTKKTSAEQQAVRTAISTLVTLLDGARCHELLPSAAEELGTRDGLERVDAEARIRGQLTDLLDILREIEASRRRRPTG